MVLLSYGFVSIGVESIAKVLPDDSNQPCDMSCSHRSPLPRHDSEIGGTGWPAGLIQGSRTSHHAQSNDMGQVPPTSEWPARRRAVEVLQTVPLQVGEAWDFGLWLCTCEPCPFATEIRVFGLATCVSSCQTPCHPTLRLGWVWRIA